MLLKEKYEEFSTTYNESEKNTIWQNHSKKIQKFWQEKIIDNNRSALSDNDIDEIVQILDRNGKGNTKDTEAIARVMIPQGAWRKLFMQFTQNNELATIIDSVLRSEQSAKSKAIDELYYFNREKKNYLTGKSGNFICSLLAGWDPFNNISIASINDRLLLMENLKIEGVQDFYSKSIGEQIIESNKKILAYFDTKLQINNGRTISVFVYSTYFKTEWKKSISVNTSQGQIDVTVPSDQIEYPPPIEKEGKESIKIQAAVAKIGALLGMYIWLPKSDRKQVLAIWKDEENNLLNSLPLSFDETAIKTVENIDVLWIDGRSIVRAFEIEHTTSIYSGILRMADLVALVPNLNVNLHIVAPVERREKVFEEIRRPVFTFIRGGSLSSYCSYLSYESIYHISEDPQLKHMKDSILDEFTELAE
ncbi:MAG: hypothetical protein AMXMBFR48_18660 [Ignavibacteriales bacterium]